MEKQAGKAILKGERRCMMVQPIRKGIQIAGRWMTRSKSHVYVTQQTQGPSAMDHDDSRVDKGKRAHVEFFSCKRLL